MRFNLNIIGMIMRKLVLPLILFIGFAYGKNSSEKPFIEEHIYHKHRIDFVNASVFQQTDGYGAFYNTTHIFMYLDLSKTEQIFINNSITLGNGLNNRFSSKGFTFLPSGDDLQDMTEDINDTGRKYILELWYKKKFEDSVFVAGLIDSASFIDENNVANDEHTQFLNSALINNPVAPIHSYNPGFYIKHDLKGMVFKTVFIKNTPEKGNTGFLQLNISKENLNVRPYYYHTFSDYENKGFGLSSDIGLGRSALFFRGSKRSGGKDLFLSAGFQIEDIFRNDRIAFGTGFIKEEIKKYVYEIYYLYRINSYISFTLDFQQIKERSSENIFGTRLYISY
ncbi:carbohydrate-selective porin, OprB family [Persephonella marina EX-H1]|uniref:Carbohydrate-selective porin, OprB family n=2 Tax=Hydrogenothermaceae TaxID=224027 RepID=C0QQV1_PERMH|nr:carbohydrate-selective porin, OprB family [Persephonella marina EX-H1]